MLVANDLGHRIASRQSAQQVGERSILRGLEGVAFETLQLDADREVIAVTAPMPTRVAGMPRTILTRNELQQISLTSNQKVRRNLNAANALIVWIRLPIESVGEQALYPVAAIDPGREADGMQYDQRDIAPIGATVEIA